jgi:uncharacterized protein
VRHKQTALLVTLVLVAFAAVAKTFAASLPDYPRADASSLPAEVTIPNTRRFDFTSSVNGHRYSISVALPFEAPKGKGYGVLYVLDGYSYFASAAEAVRGPDKAPGVVVVGIAYPDDPAYVKNVIEQRGPVSPLFEGLPPFRIDPFFERFYDLSLPTSDRALEDLSREGFPKWKSASFGGVDAFLKVIETEIKPRIAALAPIDTGDQAFFGHSFGGYAVLHALLVEPNAFRTFIIASPSIFWDNKRVLSDREQFAAAINSGNAHPRVLITTGNDERAPDLPAAWGMVDNSRELVTWLKGLHGSGGYEVADYALFDKTSHVFAPWPALARGVAFAFPTGRSIRQLDESQSTAAVSRSNRFGRR